MSKWSKGTVSNRGGKKLFSAHINYKEKCGQVWLEKVTVHANSREEAQVLRDELLEFLQVQEMVGITHG